MIERGAFPDGDGHHEGLDPARFAAMRVERFIRDRLVPAVYRETAEVSVDAWVVGGEPVPFDAAVAAEYSPFEVGRPWGRPWDTVWFRVRGTVPEAWRTQDAVIELIVDLGFDGDSAGFQAEALAYTAEGRAIKAVEPRNAWVPVDGTEGEFVFYLEAASNPNVAGDFTFAPTSLGALETAGSEPIYRLQRLELGLRDEEVAALLADATTAAQLAAELPRALPRRAELERALARMVDAVDPDDVAATVTGGRRELAEVLARPAYASAHRMLGVGHAHIDSAWLWPVRETVRKVARTFSNVLDLIDRDPEFVFAASSAQQYAWLKESYPGIFDRVSQAVAAGRFIPVGGMWVESDTNLPGGEALVRQFVTGKRFFLDEFGIETEEVWLPDSFGYTAALPQIVRQSGSRWFLTQKISWNETNRMPHHTFLWEGIDGSRVFTHFPPTDTYNGDVSGAELAKAQRQYREKGYANTSLMPFGWGDGGGGPTREMLEAAHRARDLEGSPRVELASPRRFFETAEAEYADPPVWVGELYLELHRGTYTSQARTKRGNRRSEALLHEAELWAATAAVRCGASYPSAELDRLWKIVLLQQFHDILPGSSIAWVHREAEARYREVEVALEAIIAQALHAIVGPGERELVANAGPFAVDRSAAGAISTAVRGGRPAPVRREGAVFVLESSTTRAVLDDAGLLRSLVDLRTGREVIPAGLAGNVLVLFRDTPRQWDGWDIDEDDKATFQELRAIETIEIVDDGFAVRIGRATGSSRFVETIRLDEVSGALELDFDIDWHEREKLLKLILPLDLRVTESTSEIQFGHLRRPTHRNTSWDEARFETVAHRWVHVGEPEFGVAVANDTVYGHDIRGGVAPDGRPMVTVRPSLLRAPRFPDPESDQGRHQISLSVLPGVGVEGAVQEGYRKHLPVRRITGERTTETLVAAETGGVVIETVKLADDGSGDVVVRVYEALGTRRRAKLLTGFVWRQVVETDLLERESEPVLDVATSGASLEFDLRPFQLATLRFVRAR